MYHKYLIVSLLSFFLVSCQPAQSAGTPVEVDTLQRYFQAFADKNETTFTQLVCPTWETEALLEFDAYKGLQSRVGDITCRRVSGQDQTANVNCQGKIFLSYGSENQEIDLSPRNYRLTWNGDIWQVCGYTSGNQ